MSVSIYKQLNAKLDFKHIIYFTYINWQKMAKMGADVSTRDIVFAQKQREKDRNRRRKKWCHV